MKCKPYGLANKLCYIEMLLTLEKSGEQDRERTEELLVNRDPLCAVVNN